MIQIDTASKNDDDLKDKYDFEIYNNPKICMIQSYVAACILIGTLPKVLSFVVTSGILEGCSDIVKVVAEDFALELSIFFIQQLALHQHWVE